MNFPAIYILYTLIRNYLPPYKTKRSAPGPLYCDIMTAPFIILPFRTPVFYQLQHHHSYLSDRIHQR